MGIRHGSKERPALTSRQDTSQQLVVQVMRRDLSAFSAQDRGRLLDCDPWTPVPLPVSIERDAPGVGDRRLHQSAKLPSRVGPLHAGTMLG